MHYTKQQRKEIEKKILSHIKNDENVYCRVGWAMTQIMGKDFKQLNFLKDQIAFSITSDGKYLKSKSSKTYYDWDIYMNPEYSWFSRNKFLGEIIKGAIIIIISIILNQFLTVKF